MSILNGEQQLTDLINKYDIPIVYGTDASRPLATVEFRQYDDIRKFKRRFGSLKTIRAMTGNTYELGRLCTYQHPYPDGKLGVLEVRSLMRTCCWCREIRWRMWRFWRNRPIFSWL